MNQPSPDSKKRPTSHYVAWSLTAVTVVALAGLVYGATRPWKQGAWQAADHNRDGVLTRSEMTQFGAQAPHRDGDRLLYHFDRADTNEDLIVDMDEVVAYGSNIGSKDPLNRN